MFVLINDCQLQEDCTGTQWSKLYITETLSVKHRSQAYLARENFWIKI